MPYRIAETGKSYRSLSDAVNKIGGGTGTIEVQPGIWRDCAVQEAGNITYRAATPGTAIFDGGVCEGKATLVLRGRNARVEGLIFQNIGVPDENGAGIRLEWGDLSVFNSLFRNSQQGILTAQNPGDGSSSTSRAFRASASARRIARIRSISAIMDRSPSPARASNAARAAIMLKAVLRRYRSPIRASTTARAMAPTT